MRLTLIVPMHLALLMTACTTAELSPAGTRVATTNSDPGKGCRALGQVIGKGGGAFGGGWISNEELVKYASNDARNKAAAMGGDFVKLDPPQLGTSGGKDGSTTTSATVTGTAYDCSHASHTATGERVARPKGTPNGGAGFAFGASPGETKARCEEAKQTWREDQGSYSCSGPATPAGFGGVVTVKFCGDRLCRIELATIPDDGAWSNAHKALRDKLEAKYGPAAETKADIPSDCKPKLDRCLDEGTAQVAVVWTFPGGITMKLKTGGDDTPRALKIVYEHAGKTKLESEGL